MTLFVPQPWPSGQVAVVVVTDASGVPLDEPRWFAAGTPARVDLTRDRAVSLSVRSFPTKADGGPDLEGCGVTIDAAGAHLPPPATSWRTALFVPEDTDALSFVEDSPPRDLGLAFARCAAPAYPCGDVAFEAIALTPLTDMAIADVVALSDTHAFAAGFDPQTGASGVVDVAADAPSPVITQLPLDGVHGIVRSLAWGRTGAIHGTTFGRVGFELDVDGRVLAIRETTSATAAVEASADGTLVEHGPFGLRELDAASGALVDRGMSLDRPLTTVSLVRRDRVAALTENDRLLVFDGSAWTEEYEPAPSVFEDFSSLGADESLMVAVDGDGQVKRRDEQRHAWSPFPLPFEAGPGWRDVGGLGGGRFFIVGDSGAAALWTGSQWCTWNEAATRLPLRVLSVAPSGRTIWAGSGNPASTVGRPPVLVRVTLPQ
ncbi:hypothetical protein L6R52_35485 [Myxococcota bacterium]|nr:hypothetical protein [Myxococcota bacterium]